MTSRERILAALNHQDPDRVPIDLSGHRSSGIAAMAYARLREHLGLPKKPIRVYDPVQQLAIVDEDVLQLFKVDTIELGRAFALEDKYWAEWVLPDGTPCLMPAWAKPDRLDSEWVLRSSSTGKVIARMPEGVWYFEQANFPFLEREDLDRLEAEFAECMWSGIASPPGPMVSGADGGAVLAEGARKLRQQTDRAIIGLFGGNLLEFGQWFYRNDNFFMLLAGEPERAHRFLDKLTAIHLRNLDRFLTAVGAQIDIILFGDDLGMQSGPQVSPAMYREYFQPCERAMWQMVKERAPHLKIQLHCCGGVRELLPGLIDAGLDAINPVQITCRGMEAAGLKRDFGSRLTFWGGGCDTRDMLIKGTPAQISEHVRRQVEIWRPGGGFVFQQVHNILADVPPANVVAMYDTVMRA
ncbi:MAG TPA: uroporphyrinogen decarboxylase family protein [Candidatus Paceibacterota bacterium]|nr:uroporphyrinogen decarboxylase family protein [Verrucomicrobiota bacterium]HSA12087.1 uroporphyrinogen decarboxylase family protein [Candidatus Paceibacterota bacterium]